MRLLLAVALLLLPIPAQAQGVACGEYNEFVKTLATKFHEKSIGKGISNDNTAVIELFVGKETFTILSVTTGGQACIIRAGKDWYPKKNIVGEDT